MIMMISVGVLNMAATKGARDFYLHKETVVSFPDPDSE